MRSNNILPLAVLALTFLAGLAIKVSAGPASARQPQRVAPKTDVSEFSASAKQEASRRRGALPGLEILF